MDLPVTTPAMASYTHGLIYSPARHGKTTLLASAQDDPRTSPTLLIAWEAGLQSIAHRKDVAVYQIKKWTDFNEVGNYLISDSNKYKSVGIDSFTEIHYMNLNWVAEQDGVNKGKTINKMTAPDEISQPIYGKSLRQMRFMVRFFCDLPMHVFITALVDEYQDPATMLSVRGPAVMGKFKHELPAVPDLVAYLGLGEVPSTGGPAQRILLTQPNGRYVAGVRSPGVFPSRIENPTVTKILDAVEASYK